MKKILLISITITILIAVAGLYLLRSTSGFRSIYLVPEDASIIIESKDPIGAWSGIVNSNAWEHYKTNPLFKEKKRRERLRRKVVVSVDEVGMSGKMAREYHIQGVLRNE